MKIAARPAMAKPPISSGPWLWRGITQAGGYRRSVSSMTRRTYASFGRSSTVGVLPSSTVSSSAFRRAATSGCRDSRLQHQARVIAVVSWPAVMKVMHSSRSSRSSRP
jgi:hypothetical protein